MVRLSQFGGLNGEKKAWMQQLECVAKKGKSTIKSHISFTSKTEESRPWIYY